MELFTLCTSSAVCRFDVAKRINHAHSACALKAVRHVFSGGVEIHHRQLPVFQRHKRQCPCLGSGTRFLAKCLRSRLHLLLCHTPGKLGHQFLGNGLHSIGFLLSAWIDFSVVVAPFLPCVDSLMHKQPGDFDRVSVLPSIEAHHNGKSFLRAA